MTKRKTHPKPKRRDAIKLVVKSNELVEARYMFNIWETRFFHTLVSAISKDDDEDKVYRVWFKDIKENFNINSNKSYELLREAAKSLNRKPVYVGWMDDQYRRGREYTLFEFVDYLEKGQTGKDIHKQEYTDVKIQERMRPFLLHVKKNFDPLTTRYTSYDIKNTQKLKPYAIRIYELLKQFEYIGFRTIGVQDLKDMFLITDEYPRFSTFNQSVIAPSIKAINKHTDLYIAPNAIERTKKGRKVTALRFPIQSKKKQQVAEIRKKMPDPLISIETGEKTIRLSNSTEEPVVDELFNKFEGVVVKSFGVTPLSFVKMLKTGKYKKADIGQAINVTRRAKYKQEITKNVAGFFLRALREGYTDTKEEANKKKKETTNKRKKIQEQIDLLKDEFSQNINAKIRELTSENEEVTLKAVGVINANPLTNALVRHKEKILGRPLELADYRQDGNLRSMVISSIVQTEQEHFQDILNEYNPKIITLEKQLKNWGECKNVFDD